MDQIIREYIKKYEKFILYANACNVCYFKMSYGDKEWEKVYSIAPGFFGVVRKSLQSEVFVTIGKLFEGCNRSDHNLHKFLNFVESNSKKILAEKHKALIDYVNDSRVKIDEQEYVIARVLTLRDKAYAHLDKIYFQNNKSEKQIEITFEEVKFILELAGAIVNNLNRIMFNSYTDMHYSNENDIEKLMTFCMSQM